MPVVTLTTDFGYMDYHVGAMKGLIIKNSPAAAIVDISHDIESFNITQAAFVVENSFRNFPESTVHIICVNPQDNKKSRKLCVRYENHFFLGTDNGFFSLLMKNSPQEIIVLNEIPHNGRERFPHKDFFAITASRILNGESIASLGVSTLQFEIRTSLQPLVSDSGLRGTVIHIDHFSNVIVNIHKDLFEEARRNRKFTVYFNRSDEIKQISNNYYDVQEGERICMFNSSGFLEIAINKGKASKLLGLKPGDAVLIDFENNSVAH